MTVYRLRMKQVGPKCSYCDQRARYRGMMFAKFSCDAHQSELRAWDAKESKPDYSDAAFSAGY